MKNDVTNNTTNSNSKNSNTQTNCFQHHDRQEAGYEQVKDKAAVVVGLGGEVLRPATPQQENRNRSKAQPQDGLQ